MQRKIGQGSFGDVYLVNEEGDAKELALKFLRPHLLDPKRLTRFKHEFKILSELRHKNIAGVFHFGSTVDDVDKKYFFTAEYFPGEGMLEACEKKSTSYF